MSWRDCWGLSTTQRKTRENVASTAEWDRSWWQRMWKRSGYSISSSGWPLLVRFRFRKPRPLRPEGTTRVRNTYSHWRKTRLGSIKRTRDTQVFGTWQFAPMSPQGACWCHCEATLYYLWRVMVMRRSSWRLEDSNCHSHLQEEQEVYPGKLQASQPHLQPLGRWWPNPSENHVQKPEGQEGDLK